MIASESLQVEVWLVLLLELVVSLLRRGDSSLTLVCEHPYVRVEADDDRSQAIQGAYNTQREWC